MASAKDLRKRIGSVKNTQQITKAMKMVAAAKLRRAQEAILALRPYAHEMNQIVSGLTQNTGDDVTHPLLVKKEKGSIKKALVVVVTSDRGLCAGFNGGVIKATQNFRKTHASTYESMDFAFIGKKGFEFFKKQITVKHYYEGFFTKLTLQKSQGLAEELIQLYLSNEYDEIKFIYNEFKSALSQKVCVENFLPIQPAEESKEKEPQEKTASCVAIYEPNLATILDALLSKCFAIQIHKILLESLTGEHAARMAAMENATKNAGEMIKKITLLYNKTRQAGITKELLEIVSGNEAQKG